MGAVFNLAFPRGLLTSYEMRSQNIQNPKMTLKCELRQYGCINTLKSICICVYVIHIYNYIYKNIPHIFIILQLMIGFLSHVF